MNDVWQENETYLQFSHELIKEKKGGTSSFGFRTMHPFGWYNWYCDCGLSHGLNHDKCPICKIPLVDIDFKLFKQKFV